MEYRRLLWKRNAMFPRDATGRPQRTREVNRAARTLDWERKSIAQQIKWDMTEQVGRGASMMQCGMIA